MKKNIIKTYYLEPFVLKKQQKRANKRNIQPMIDYQLGKIYTLVNTINNTIYVGSTTRKYLSTRMAAHRASADDPKQMSSLYAAMRTLGSQNFTIVLHHNFPSQSKNELEAEEYKTLTQLRAAGALTYNQKLDTHGLKWTEAAKQKLSAAKLAMNLGGENSPFFSFGSVSYHTQRNSWQFGWYDNGKQRNKRFSIGKFGNYGAHFRIEEFRKTIYPEYGTLEDIACDDLGHIEW